MFSTISARSLLRVSAPPRIIVRRCRLSLGIRQYIDFMELQGDGRLRMHMSENVWWRFRMRFDRSTTLGATGHARQQCPHRSKTRNPHIKCVGLQIVVRIWSTHVFCCNFPIASFIVMHAPSLATHLRVRQRSDQHCAYAPASVEHRALLIVGLEVLIAAESESFWQLRAALCRQNYQPLHL